MNDAVFTAFPVLETERLLLRDVAHEDLEMIYQFNADPQTLRFVPRDPYTDRLQAIEKIAGFHQGYRNRQGVWWTFTLKETGELLGYGGLFDIANEGTKAEIGYGILQKHWGQGYMSEAVAEMTRFGLEDLGLQRLFGRVDPANTASGLILAKLGYEKEGCLRCDMYARGEFFDMDVWGRVKGDDHESG